MQRYIVQLLTVLCLANTFALGQASIETEPVLQLVTRLTTPLPRNMQDAYQKRNAIKLQLDSFDNSLQRAYQSLANKMQKRSARLNSMASYNEEGATLLFIVPNDKMRSFFISQWDKMDAQEKTFNQKVKTIEGLKELYKIKGYLPVWDSAYNSRLPALARYRDEILKLVQTEIAYLKANAKMFASSNEDERMQWTEAELGILQKLVLLTAKIRKVVVLDAIEKVEYHDKN